MDWVETRTGFFTDGKLYSMSNTIEFLKFPPLRLIDKFRLGATIFYASRVKNWKKLEEVLVADWLLNLSGRRTFESIWLPLLRAKLGENYRHTSAAFIWATIARMYAARRTGLKKEMFGYVRGGYARVLKRFAELLETEGVTIRTNCAATSIRDSRGGVSVEFASGPRETFDQVVLTVPAPLASNICEGLTSEEHNRLNGIKYQGIVCASVLLRRPLGGFYVTNITDTSIPFTAVIEMSAMVDPKQFGGNHLVYLPKYVDPSDVLFSKTDEEIRESFLDGLARMYPDLTADDILAFRISRVKHVFPIPTLNYSSRLPTIRTSIPGVHILNSAHIVNGTLNVNETVQLAESAVEEFLKHSTSGVNLVAA
jgi:protoporphyrinogen oxidase